MGCASALGSLCVACRGRWRLALAALTPEASAVHLSEALAACEAARVARPQLLQRLEERIRAQRVLGVRQEALWDLGAACSAARVAARKGLKRQRNGRRGQAVPGKQLRRCLWPWSTPRRSDATTALWPEVRADAVALGAAITACERGSRWEEALQLLSFELKLDVVCCNAALSACENLGRRMRHYASHLISLVALCLRRYGARQVARSSTATVPCFQKHWMLTRNWP